MVDFVIVYDSDTPTSLLSVLKPNTIAKGGDYTPDTVAGREYCEKVMIFDYIKGISSTHTIAKIVESNFVESKMI